MPLAVVALAASAVLVVGCGSDPAPPEPAPPGQPSREVGVPTVGTIDVAGARAALEAGQGEIRRILEAELGADGWTEARPAQENVSTSCGTSSSVGKFYAREMSHPRALADADWERAWGEIVRAVTAHGFRPKEGGGEGGGGETGAERYRYLINEHRDELTVSSLPGIGTGYGGYSVCHPWER